MQSKVLIVDAIATNRIILKVKLKTAYYGVCQAATMADAVEAVRSEMPDLVITALTLPDGSAADLFQALQRIPAVEHIPVIGIGCQSKGQSRIETLNAGVHDILAQPVDETLLLGRVRSLIRDCNTIAEWRLREDTCRALGLAEPSESFDNQGHCALVGGDLSQLRRFAELLRPRLRSKLTLTPSDKLMNMGVDDVPPDIFVLILPEDLTDAMSELRLISALRASATTRYTGVIALQTSPDSTLAASALDLGADDIMTDGFDAAELALRIKAVMRRKKMGEQLRNTVRTGLQAAVFDPLTGLYNRRYAMPHLARITQHARDTGRPFAVMAADLDHFKRVNDAYGHASGDAVLVEVAQRLRQSLRGADMVARIGGEEFLVILPGASLPQAQDAALRICQSISSKPFIIPGSRLPIEVTISIGMAIGGKDEPQAGDADETGLSVLDQADRALYAAKGRGRNQVKLGRPAA